MVDENMFLEPIAPNESGRIVRALREETTGGLLLIATSLFALVLANSPLSKYYESLTAFKFGPQSLHLNLTVAQWAADFLLAVFFFVVGNELKHEIVKGSLSNPREALVPIVAALSGMTLAAGIFLALNHGEPAASAWGIPISTDVAFALAVLALAGRGLPLELRSFLLTVAVVNDLGAISVIAIFYDQGFHLIEFIFAIISIAIFAILQRHYVTSLWLSIPLALNAWYWMYQSGIHSTIAGVALGLSMNVHAKSGQSQSPADRAEHLLRPISAGICVPIFAFTSIGIALESGALSQMFHAQLTQGILFGLVIGQPVGVTLGAFLTTKLTRGSLNPLLSWWDVLIVGMLAAIGFTVALLVSEVSFHDDVQLLST
ncbi:MAG: Na+/H+ antiporter NhaA, partial [Actinobacteria bacterium]|nr:Na+/H+ antiporter NhaA [Actinomycetota bacterium]